ncbi:MAG: hypothetical protein KC468_19705, partial [Myxococcales bacterium]|nr:hypothetical protein [Myxococcales bacterium]
MSSPSIAPDPRRLAQAHAAGLRPTSRWLRLSAHAVVIVLLAPWAIATVTADLGQCWRGAMDTGAGAGAAECSLPGLAAVVGALLLAVALAELAVASLTGRAGQLDRARRGRLGRVGSWREHGGGAHLVLALLVGAILMIVADPQVAGNFNYLFTSPGLALGNACTTRSTPYRAMLMGAVGSPQALAATSA